MGYSPVESVVETSAVEMVVQALYLSFRDDGKWRVTDGIKTQFVRLEDEAFIKRINDGELTNDLKWLQFNIRNLEDYATKRVGNHNEHTSNTYHASEPIRLTAFNLIYGKNDENGHQGLDITPRCFCACLGIQYSEPTRKSEIESNLR